MANRLKLHHVADPKQEMLDAIGDISSVEVFHNQILVQVYIRPNKTASGLFLSDKTRDEDRFQGKSGLVLKKGPLAFVDDEANKFAGQNVNVGDWVFYRVSDGFPITINGQLCRLLEEVHIKGRISEPDAVY
jgi:co-chaperonin GroES (HSP10)